MGGVGRKFELLSTHQLHRSGRLHADEQGPEEHCDEEYRPRDGFQQQQVRLDPAGAGQALPGDDPVVTDTFGL